MDEVSKIVDSGRNLFTQSRFKCFRDCPRRHYYRFELGINKQAMAQPLRMGSAYHLGQELLASIKTGLSDDDRKEEQEKAILAAIMGYAELPPPFLTPIEWAIERETVARLLQGYAWRWQSDHIEIIEAEIPFKIPLVNPATNQQVYRFIQKATNLPPQRIPQFLCGVIDKIVKLEDGRLAILEHKTTGDGIKPDSRYWKQRQMDQQTAFYFRCAVKLGIDVQTIVYDVIRKPSIKPSSLTQGEFRKFIGIPSKLGADILGKDRHHYFGEKCEVDFHGVIEENGDWTLEKVIVDGYEAEQVDAGKKKTIRETPSMYGARLVNDLYERPEMYFAREPIDLTEKDLLDLEADVFMYHQMILLSQTANRWPKNTDRCTDYGTCDFYPTCSTNANPEESIPEGMVELQFVHPELAERILDDRSTTTTE